MFLSEELKNKIISILEDGGVIAYVTDTVWGLGALPYSQKGVQKIYEIKKREAQKPLILMSNEIENLLPYVQPVSDIAKNLFKKYFPGALTLVLKKTDKAEDYMTSGFDTVGVRIPDNQVFKEICEAIPGHVLATTSANLSNEPSAKTYEQAVLNMGEKADLIVHDFGQSAKGLESTVVLVTEDGPKVLRQGAIIL